MTMESSVYGIPAVVLAFNLYVKTEAMCTKPALNKNSYSYTEEKSSYGLNETYEIYCAPGYISSGSSDLVCTGLNQWSRTPPECTPSEGTYPWWMLLVAVTLVILVVACILPRFLACCLSKTKKKHAVGDDENGLDDNDDYDDDDDEDNRPESPVPNFSRRKNMNNMEFMAKLHEDADRKTLKRATKNATF